MKRFLATALAVLALVGCNSGTGPGGRSEARLQMPLATTVTLTHSNISELDGQVAIAVTTELVGGNTVVTIPAITSWPVGNTFLGLDQFYYAESATDHPIIQVKDQGCDELVIGGMACGWTVNYDGTIADGFGSFASRKSASPASQGATTQDLVFVLLGNAELVANDHGAMFAVHGRFDHDCSGWFSDGTSPYVGSDPACYPRCEQCEYSCSLSVEPAALELLAGGWGNALVTVNETGSPQVPITLSIGPMPLPPGITVGLSPNPVNPPLPGTSVLNVQTLASTPLGPTQIVITGEGQSPTGLTFQCTTTLDLNIVTRPPGACYCPTGP